MESLIKQIDDVLNAIHDKKAPVRDDIEKRLKEKNVIIEDYILEAILLQLIDDKHIVLTASGQYILTYGGQLFKHGGGYSAKSLANAADAEQQRLEIARLKSVDVSSDLNQKRLNKLTNRLSWAAWFAFVAALALLAWQMYSYYHPIPAPPPK